MAELIPQDYDLDTGEFIWSPHRGPLVLFGTLSSIWALVWLVVAHKYKEIKLNEIVSLIEELGFLKTTCMKEGRSLDEIRDSERLLIYRRLGQQVSSYMNESEKQKFLEYDLNVIPPSMPSLSLIDNIAYSKLFTLKFISFKRVKELTYSIYWIGFAILAIFIVLLSVSVILDFTTDWSSTINSQNFFQAITGIVYLPTFFLLFFFIRKWKKGYQQSLKEQMNLLTDTCENAENIEKIEKRLTQFILADTGVVNGLRNKEGNILFPYLMFKRTNASWNFNMLSISISKYDYMYFLFFLFTLPLLLLFFNFFAELNELVSTPLAIFLNIVLLTFYFVISYIIFFIGVVGIRFLLFSLLRVLFVLDGMRFTTRREGSVPERYKMTKRTKWLFHTSIVLLIIGIVISGALYSYTGSFFIFLLFIVPFLLPYMLFFFIPIFIKSLKPETETVKTSEIRYISPHQMYTKGFFAQYVWEVTMAFIVFICFLLFIFLILFSFFTGGLIITEILWLLSLFASVSLLVSFFMSGFFVYYFSIELFKNPINTVLSTILEEKEIKMMTSLSDSTIFEEINKEELEFRFSVLDAGMKFVEKYKRGRQWERFNVIVGFLFTTTISFIIDYIL